MAVVFHGVVLGRAVVFGIGVVLGRGAVGRRSIRRREPGLVSEFRSSRRRRERRTDETKRTATTRGPAEDEGGDGKDACATGPGPPVPPPDVTLEIRVGGTPGEDDGMARTVGPLPPRSGTAWTPRRRDDDDASDDKGARARLSV